MRRLRGSTAGAQKSATTDRDDTLDAAQLQAQAVAIGVRSGSAHAIRLRCGAAERRTDARRRSGSANRLRTRRASGSSAGSATDARRPVSHQPPEFPPVPTNAALLERLPSHPELDVLRQRINESQTDVDLAEAKRSPDWRVEFGYGYRRDYSDMVMLQVGMDLPVFCGQPPGPRHCERVGDGRRRGRAARRRRASTRSACGGSPIATRTDRPDG